MQSADPIRKRLPPATVSHGKVLERKAMLTFRSTSNSSRLDHSHELASTVFSARTLQLLPVSKATCNNGAESSKCATATATLCQVCSTLLASSPDSQVSPHMPSEEQSVLMLVLVLVEDCSPRKRRSGSSGDIAHHQPAEGTAVAPSGVLQVFDRPPVRLLIHLY